MDVDDLNDSITSCSGQHVSGLRSCVAKTLELLKLLSSREATLTCKSAAFNPVLVPPHGHTIPHGAKVMLVFLFCWPGSFALC